MSINYYDREFWEAQWSAGDIAEMRAQARSALTINRIETFLMQVSADRAETIGSQPTLAEVTAGFDGLICSDEEAAERLRETFESSDDDPDILAITREIARS